MNRGRNRTEKPGGSPKAAPRPKANDPPKRTSTVSATLDQSTGGFGAVERSSEVQSQKLILTEGRMRGLTAIAVAASIGSAVAACFQWASTEKQVDLMAKQVKLSQDIFISTERPWVASDVALTSPLVWEGQRGKFLLTFLLRNTGHTPALNVSVSPELYFWSSEKMTPFRKQAEIAEARRAFMMNNKGKNEWSDGATIGSFTLFPGSTLPQPISMEFSTEEIDEYRKNHQSDDPLWLPQIYIVGYIGYRDSLSKEYHQTGFILKLIQIAPNSKGVAVLRQEDTPLSHIRVMRSEFGDGGTY